MILMDFDESIDLPLANGSQNRFLVRGHLAHTSRPPRGHLVHTSAVTPCGHTVWTLFFGHGDLDKIVLDTDKR